MSAQQASSRVGAPVAILGMHRSGTSCFAGCLEEAGLFLGEVNTKAPANARGNRENRQIMDLHDEVLAHHSCSWDAPPDKVLVWTVQQKIRLQELIASYPAQQCWGFKDPRSVLLLDQWIALIPNLRLVGSLRHPANVAASLRRRNKFSWQQGYALWLAYNQHLYACLQKRPFTLINFDQEPAGYRDAVGQIVADLELQIPTAGLKFFSQKLRNELPDSYPELPDEVASLYQNLLLYSL
ncbi:MAG: sulfotransferase [Oceanococcus sp.]